MKNIFNFKRFILESSSAGSRNYKSIDFKFRRNKNHEYYDIDDLIEDIKFHSNKNEDIKRSISQIIDQYVKRYQISSIRDLDYKSELPEFIEKIEEIISKNGEPDVVLMPGESFLFIRDHKNPDGTISDFYMNKNRTKIEVISFDDDGEENSEIIPIESFDPYRFGLSDEDVEIFRILKEGE